MRSTLLGSKTRDLPQEWATCKLYELASFTKGKQPTRFHDRYEKGFLPYLTTDYLRGGLSPKYCHVNDDVVRADAHDALLIWDGSNAGEFFAGVNGAVASTMVKVWGKDANTIHDKFLFYVLMNSSKILSSTTNGTSIPHVSLSVFKNLGIPLPPLPEQHKIAEILSTVDETIEKTDSIIQETQQLKKGLMQKLFTKGIGHTRFKETKIGRTPEEWEVVRFNQCLQKTRQKDPTKIPDEKFTYIDVSAVSNEFFKIVESKSILGKDAPSRARKGIKTGDTIYATVRPYLRRVAFVPSKLDGAICSTGYCVLRPKSEEVSRRFIFQLMLTHRVNGYLESLQVGTSYPAISDSDVYQMLIPKPPLPEQSRIAEILSEVDARIETEWAFRSELEKLKKGLMQVLLTGKVRVKV